MSKHSSIAVVSRTFSNVPELVAELNKYFTNVRYNPTEKLKGESLVEFIGDAEAALVALEQVDGAVLDACPNLKIVSKYGVGLDNIDLAACKERGVKIGWTGGTNRLSVAEMAVGFMLSLARNLFKTSYELKRGIWNKDGGRQLSARTVGVIGVGFTGKEVIRLLKPFNCRILVNDIIDQREYYEREGLIEATKEQIFKEADVITLHVPLTKETERMINQDTLALMQPTTFVINSARGPLIDLQALKRALQNGTIAGAAIDVYDEEPPRDIDLLSLNNLICTPHIGGNSREAVLAMGMAAIEHLKEHFLKEEPK
jgi:D-3-phosphoglycerate dehydrogenase